MIQAVEEDWPTFAKVTVSEDLSPTIARLVATYPLRAFDAIHVASALLLKKRVPDQKVTFAAFDLRQNDAAHKEGLVVLSRKREQS